MPVDFDFYRAPQTPFDFSPLVEGGKALGEAYAGIGKSIGAGLIERARMQEKQRQFDLQQTIRAALMKAQVDREIALAKHQAALEAQATERTGLERQRLQLEQKKYDDQAAQMAQFKAMFAGASPSQGYDAAGAEAAFSSAYGGTPPAPRIQAQMSPDAMRRAAIFAPPGMHEAVSGYATFLEKQLQKAHAESMAGAASKLNDEMLRAGDIDEQEHALNAMRLDPSDINEVQRVAHEMTVKHGAKTQEAIDDDLKKTGPKELLNALTEKRKAMEEAGLKMDPEDFLEARSLAVSFGRSLSKGAALAAEFKQLQAKMASAGTAKKADEPKLALPSGGTVVDKMGLSAGGNFEDATPQQQQAFLAIGRQAAQKDPAWHMTLAMKPEDARRAQDLLAIRYANEIAVLNGWHAGPGAEQAAPPAPAQAPEDILRDEVNSGKIQTDAELEARAKELGVKLK